MREKIRPLFQLLRLKSLVSMVGEEARVMGASTNWFYRALNNNESNYEISLRHRKKEKVVEEQSL